MFSIKHESRTRAELELIVLAFSSTLRPFCSIFRRLGPADSEQVYHKTLAFKDSFSWSNVSLFDEYQWCLYRDLYSTSFLSKPATIAATPWRLLKIAS